MSRTYLKLSLIFAGAMCMFGFVSQSNADDIIVVEKSAVDPAALPTILEAERFWDSRIIGYSSEVPSGLRNQLSRLTITATVAPIDGPGGTLGFAGPDAIVSIGVGNTDTDGRFYTLPVVASMTFDLDDFPDAAAEGFLFDLVAHEMGHAIGVGSLFADNSLTGMPQGIALEHYTGHKINGGYALAAYRRDSPFRVAGYVPLEQTGGAGTAGGHWADLPPYFNQVFTGAFTKEFMTGFLSDLDPVTGAVVTAPKFYSETTFGSCADMGYAVARINGELKGETGGGTGKWPKTTGPGTDPFNNNGVATGDDGLNFSFVTLKKVYRKGGGSEGTAGGDIETDPSKDPYNLRDHRWTDKK